MIEQSTTLTRQEEYYLMGDWQSDSRLEEGLEGYISVCGHQNFGESLNRAETSVVVV